MKKSKLITIICFVGLIIFTVSGCASKTDALFDAIEKTEDINSYGFKMNGNINIDIPKQEQQTPIMFDMSNVSFSAEGEVVQKKDKWYKSKMKINTGFIDLNMFADISYKDNMQYKIFTEIPEFIKISELQQVIGDAEYFYLDSESLKEMQSNSNQSEDISIEDMTKMQKNLINIKKGFTKFTKEYSKKNKEFIKDKGEIDVDINGETQKANSYEIMLDNESLKKYLKSYLSDKKRAAELEDLFSNLNKLSTNKNVEEFDIEKISKDVDEMPEFIGEQGIVLEYVVKDGYVVKNNFNIDIKSEDMNINYVISMDLFDINKDIKVEIPNKEDVKYIDLKDFGDFGYSTGNN